MTIMHHTENQISKRHMSMSNQTTLDMLSTKYLNLSTKGWRQYLKMQIRLIERNSTTRKRYLKEVTSTNWNRTLVTEYNKRKSKNILHFTPPLWLSVETKIGKRFLEIVHNQNLGPTHPHHKIFNRKLLKISYSCCQIWRARYVA